MSILKRLSDFVRTKRVNELNDNAKWFLDTQELLITDIDNVMSYVNANIDYLLSICYDNEVFDKDHYIEELKAAISEVKNG